LIRNSQLFGKNARKPRGGGIKLYVIFNADQMMYWVSVDNPAVEMSSLNGTGRLTLLNETKANYTGITLYKDSLYISDKTRRFVFSYSFNISIL